jgi:hypothetical protein
MKVGWFEKKDVGVVEMEVEFQQDTIVQQNQVQQPQPILNFQFQPSIQVC